MNNDFIKLLKNFKSTCDKPILQCVKICQDKLIFTDIDKTIVIKNIKQNLNIKTEEFDQPYIISRFQLIKFLKNKGNVFLSLTDNNKTVNLNSYKTNMKMTNYDDSFYPDLSDKLTEENNNNAFIVHSESNLTKSILECSKFALKDQNRYSLNSVKIDFDNNMTIATDQVCLRINNFYGISKYNNDKIGHETYIDLSSIDLFKNIQINKIYAEEKYSKFSGLDIDIILRNLEITFPNYQNAFDNFKNSDTVKINTKNFQDCMNDINMITCEQCENFSFNGIDLEMNSPLGSVKTSIDSTTNYDLGIIGMNSKRVNKYLTLKKPDFVAYLSGPKKPVIFQDSEGLFFMSPTSL